MPGSKRVVGDTTHVDINGDGKASNGLNITHDTGDPRKTGNSILCPCIGTSPDVLR